jgi:hypothetical protein
VDRASRCTEHFARLLRLSEEQDWRLIVTEMGIDSRTPMGKAMAHMAVVFAELECDFIRMRTREALQAKKENGVKLGRPISTPDDVVAPRCAGAHGGQDGIRHCRDLNKDAVPTAQGARAWSQATVRALLMREGVHYYRATIGKAGSTPRAPVRPGVHRRRCTPRGLGSTWAGRRGYPSLMWPR